MVRGKLGEEGGAEIGLRVGAGSLVGVGAELRVGAGSWVKVGAGVRLGEEGVFEEDESS